jgi:hypothetical protein
MRMKEKVRLYVSRLLSPKENMALFLCRTPLCLYNEYEILTFHIVGLKVKMVMAIFVDIHSYSCDSGIPEITGFII